MVTIKTAPYIVSSLLCKFVRIILFNLHWCEIKSISYIYKKNVFGRLWNLQKNTQKIITKNIYPVKFHIVLTYRAYAWQTQSIFRIFKWNDRVLTDMNDSPEHWAKWNIYSSICSDMFHHAALIKLMTIVV